MDRPNADPEILRDDLQNLRTINRMFGGLAAVRKNILPLIERIPPDREIHLLDLATGSADHPVSIVQLAKRLGRKIHITAVDNNSHMLRISREETKGISEIIIDEQDIRHPSYPDRSFDVVLCSLALHHFSRADAITILSEMKRLSRVGLLVNELNRSWVGAWTAWLYTRLTTRNPMTLFDSPLSVLRAFTIKELRTMALEAGIENPILKRQPMFRLVLIAES